MTRTAHRGRDVAALTAIGLIAGAMASLLGVGGGTVIVPLLLLLMGFGVREATATSLAAITIISAVGVATHGVFGHVAWGYAVLLGLPAIGGLMVGLRVKERVRARALTISFAVVLVAIAVSMVVRQGGGEAHPSLMVGSALGALALGFLAGGLAGVFGIGGGVLFVPALTLVLGLSQRDAVGTSLFAVLIVSSLGSWRQHTTGHIRWDAAAIMGAASVVTAYVGAMLAHDLSSNVLRVAFACLLVFTAGHLVVRCLRGTTCVDEASTLVR